MSGNESSQRESSFDGIISEIPEISVDNFENKNKLAYFLSHMHTDHTVGLFGFLNTRRLRSNGAKIYMTKESNIILSHQMYDSHYENIRKIVEPLRTDITYTINLPNETSFQVTLIPATHMIGAVMFLFRTRHKTVLYTGDFVLQMDEVSTVKRLHDNRWTPIFIDTLYVDATFDNPDYEHFPSREAAHIAVGDKVEDWLETDNHRVAIYSRYPFGYEDVYRILSRRVKTKVFVPAPTDKKQAKMHDIFEALYGDRNFTTESTDGSVTKIHMCKNRNLDTNHSYCGLADSRGLEYIHIYMSAQTGYNHDPDNNESALTEVPWLRNSPQSFYLCYQTHCSRSQLEYFINYFNPGRTKRFPKKPVTTPTSGSPYKRDNRRPYVDRDSVKKRLFNPK